MSDNPFENDPYIQALVTLHHKIPRGGPGSDRNTLKALRLLPGLPPKPRVIDLGCGPGKQSLALARELGVKVTAVDIFEVFLEQLKADAQERGLGDMILPVQADMTKLQYPENSWDLVWSEGAIYLAGFEHGLRMCNPWLGSGGLMAVTECSWLKPGAPQKVTEFWSGNYPAMQDIETNIRTAQQAGYQMLNHFILPESDWLQEYWAPMLPRLDELEATAQPGSSMARVIADTRLEIELYKKYSEYYGYVFYLMRVAD